MPVSECFSRNDAEREESRARRVAAARARNVLHMSSKGVICGRARIMKVVCRGASLAGRCARHMWRLKSRAYGKRATRQVNPRSACGMYVCVCCVPAKRVCKRQEGRTGNVATRKCAVVQSYSVAQLRRAAACGECVQKGMVEGAWWEVWQCVKGSGEAARARMVKSAAYAPGDSCSRVGNC